MSGYNNNFGSNPDPYTAAQELSARDRAIMAEYIKGCGDTSYDDLFDDAVYRNAQTTFSGQSHRLKPQSQTYYRPAVRYATQGIPEDLSLAHGGHQMPTRAEVVRQQRLTPHQQMKASRDLSWKVAREGYPLRVYNTQYYG